MEKMIKVFKNLARYRSENNFELSK